MGILWEIVSGILTYFLPFLPGIFSGILYYLAYIKSGISSVAFYLTHNHISFNSISDMHSDSLADIILSGIDIPDIYSGILFGILVSGIHSTWNSI